MANEVTLYELKQLILKGHRKTEELGAEIAELKGQMAGTKVLAAAIDELTAATDEQTLINRAIAQHYEGVRRLGETTYDMTRGCTKRVRSLVQALVRCNVVTVEALAEDDTEAEDEGASVSAIHGSPPR
jgi:hypothetical protein